MAGDTTLHQLLKQMVEMGASDLHLTTNSPPMVRLDGRLIPLPYPPLTVAETNRLLDAAGLPAEGFGPAITANPVLCDLVAVLQDEAVPQADRDELLAILDHSVRLVARRRGRAAGA